MRQTQVLLGPKHVLALILAVSVASLAAAFAGQYLFGLEPCVLCLYQRLPYAAAAVVAGVGLAGLLGRGRTLPIGVCAAIFAAGFALAVYHVGVEEHWWASIAGCGGGPVSGVRIDDLRPEALLAATKPCDQVDWRLFGLSLAGYNVIASATLALGCAAAAAVLQGRRHAS